MKKNCDCKTRVCKHVQEDLELRRAAQKIEPVLTGQVRGVIEHDDRVQV